jgi:hypothetical protein
VRRAAARETRSPHAPLTSTPTMSADGSSSSSPSGLHDLLGSHPSSQKLQAWLSSLCASAGAADASLAPEVKAYPDAVYCNYHRLGLSILFSPQGSYKPKTAVKLADLKDDALVLDSIDFYNVPAPSTSASAAAVSKPSSAAQTYETFVALPLSFSLSPGVVGEEPRPEALVVTATSTGKDFVSTLGEPDRKGGGAGPSSGSIGIWCEFSKDGLMVEFGGDGARGPQAWEKGKDAPWKVLTVFAPKTE